MVIYTHKPTSQLWQSKKKSTPLACVYKWSGQLHGLKPKYNKLANTTMQNLRQRSTNCAIARLSPRCFMYTMCMRYTTLYPIHYPTMHSTFDPKHSTGRLVTLCTLGRALYTESVPVSACIPPPRPEQCLVDELLTTWEKKVRETGKKNRKRGW